MPDFTHTEEDENCTCFVKRKFSIKCQLCGKKDEIFMPYWIRVSYCESHHLNKVNKTPILCDKCENIFYEQGYESKFY